MKRLIPVISIVVGLGIASAGAAAAGVSRYQIEASTYLLDIQFAGTHYFHAYSVITNPCNGTFSATGEFLGTGAPGSAEFTETVSDWAETSITISFETAYDPPGPTPYSFDFVGIVDGVETWLGEGTSSVGQVFDDMTLTRTAMSVTDYKNHADFVKDQGNSPEYSCIGMPTSAPADLPIP